MANTTIDFGQTSTPQLSLRPFLNKQETAVPVAQDIAQAIQLAGNAGKMLSAVDEEAQQAKHFNALTAFNNIRSQQQEEMLAAGNDLNAQRQILDKYKTEFASLQSIYNLNEKYAADMSTKIEGHTSAWEEHYRGKYNAQQEGIADTNIAETIKSMITAGVTKEDITTTLAGLREYRKQMTGSSDERATAAKIADMFGQARIVSMDKETLTFQQARSNKKETLEILEEFDPKITTTAEYRKLKDAFDFVEEKKRTEEVNVFEKYLKEALVPPKEAQKAIALKVAEGLVKPEHAELMFLTSKNNYEDRQATLRNRAYAEEARRENQAEKELRLTYYQHANGNSSVEDMSKVLYDTAAKLGLDRRYADHFIDTYKKPFEAAIAKKQVNQEKEKIGNLLENKTIVHDGKEVSPAEFKESLMTAYGVFGQEQQNKYNAYNTQYIAAKSPDMFAATPKAAWGVHANDAAANAPMVAQKFLLEGDIGKVARLAESYGASNLKLSEFFNVGYKSKDPAVFNKTMTAFVSLKKALPLSYDDVIGKEVAQQMGAMQDILAKTGKAIPDANTWSAVEDTLKNPIDYGSQQYRAARDSMNTFMDKNGILNRREIMDKLESRYRMGQSFSEAAKELQESHKKLDIGNKDVDIFSYGKEVGSFTKDVLDRGTKHITELSGGVISGYAYNPATNTMWFSTPTNKFAFRTEDSLEDFSKNIHASILTTKSKEQAAKEQAKIDKENASRIDPETKMMLGYDNLSLKDSGADISVTDVMFRTPTESDKKRLKRIVTGKSE